MLKVPACAMHIMLALKSQQHCHAAARSVLSLVNAACAGPNVSHVTFIVVPPPPPPAPALSPEVAVAAPQPSSKGIPAGAIGGAVGAVVAVLGEPCSQGIACAAQLMHAYKDSHACAVQTAFWQAH